MEIFTGIDKGRNAAWFEGCCCRFEYHALFLPVLKPCCKADSVAHPGLTCRGVSGWSQGNGSDSEGTAGNPAVSVQRFHQRGFATFSFQQLFWWLTVFSAFKFVEGYREAYADKKGGLLNDVRMSLEKEAASNSTDGLSAKSPTPPQNKSPWSLLACLLFFVLEIHYSQQFCQAQRVTAVPFLELLSSMPASFPLSASSAKNEGTHWTRSHSQNMTATLPVCGTGLCCACAQGDDRCRGPSSTAACPEVGSCAPHNTAAPSQLPNICHPARKTQHPWSLGFLQVSISTVTRRKER